MFYAGACVEHQVAMRPFVVLDIRDDRLLLRDCETRSILRNEGTAGYRLRSAPEDQRQSSRAAWERIVFCNSSHFRVCWKGRPGQMLGEDHSSWLLARQAAQTHRGLVYAVTAAGRSAPFGEKEWPDLTRLWYSLPGNKSNPEIMREAGHAR